MLAIFDISNGYKIFGLLHILSAIVASGPLFAYPAMRRAGDNAGIAKLHMQVSFPALCATFGFGMGLVGMSDKAIKVSQTWITLALLGWVILMAVSWFLIRPATLDSSEDATKKFSAGVGISHLVLSLILILMVFKPGF